MLSIDRIISRRYKITNKSRFRKFIVVFLRLILREKQLNHLQSRYSIYSGSAFCSAILGHFDISVSYRHHELENIPSQNGCLIIANQPVGALDALALVHVVSQVRSDIKIIADDLLTEVDSLKDSIIPMNYDSDTVNKESLDSIIEHSKSGVIIFFPAQEVSRKTLVEPSWNPIIVNIMRRIQSPLLPIYIKAHHSLFFLLVSFFSKSLSKLLLPSEMWWGHGSAISFEIGKLISYEKIFSENISDATIIKKLRKHLLKIGKGLEGIYQTETGIALPQNRKDINAELQKHTLLDEISEGLLVYSCTLKNGSALLLEIARLREISFRASGTGSGNAFDSDSYDSRYQHLVLWSSKNLEIVGAYRYWRCSDIIDKDDFKKIYTSSLYTFSEAFQKILPASVEFGRIFVQPRYWNTRALDYLWNTIAVHVVRQDIPQYFFGPVSLPSSLPPSALALIIAYYSQNNHDTSENEPNEPNEPMVTHRNPFIINNDSLTPFKSLLENPNEIKREQDFRLTLKMMSVRVPVLFKQYRNLVEPGGVRFMGFGYDTSFSNCIDGIVLIDCKHIKQARMKRWLSRQS